MRKLLLVAITSFAMSFAQAQDENVTTVESAESSVYKQNAGDKNLELQFAPLGGSPISISGIRFRYFMEDKMAVRANVFIGYNTNKTIDNPAEPDDNYTRTSTFEFSLRPGIEKHFEGTDRLSPYIGAEVDLGFRTVGQKTVANGDETKVKNPNDTDGFFRIGANAVAGFDYYFAKKLYVGAELGYGLGLTNYSAMKAEGMDDVKRGSEFNFAPTVNSAIRLGFLF